ncbi:YbhB/YbcL family Raf kinase inhibitor-like protein [Nocardia tengchongensis]|uniref:YbhB/YbcL family Raf kinase inhibitor-like protein n=1 Tax=Nocardia tengchongensis TaxID=2055889 RepID=UPI0036954BAB
MALLGKLLKNRRAGDAGLAWNRPGLSESTEITITSTDFAHEETLPDIHAGKRIGGKDESPALTWSAPSEGTAQLLLVIEDPDAPGSAPFVHCLALLEPTVTELPRGALGKAAAPAGVQLLRSDWGRGYMGPSPIKGHGPHRYAFQIFALTEPLTEVEGKPVDSVKPKQVLAVARAQARGRIDGFYERA